MQSRIHRPNGHRHIIIITMFIPTNTNSVSLCLKNNLAIAWQLGLSFVCQSKCQNAVHLSNHKEIQSKEIWRRYFSSFYIGLTINNRIACPSWWRHRILDKTMKYFWKQRPFLMPLPLPSSNHLYCGPFVQRVLIFYQYVLIYVESTVGSISWILSHSWCALCVLQIRHGFHIVFSHCVGVVAFRCAKNATTATADATKKDEKLPSLKSLEQNRMREI